MTTAEFKKVGRLLKEVYAELDKEALASGVDLFSQEFKDVQGALRLEILKRMGFTIEEYRQAKELVAPAKKVDVANQLAEVSGKTSQLESSMQNLNIPNEEELLAKAKQIAEEVVKPQVIQNNIVERKVIEKPTIIRETIKETVNTPFDPNPIYAELGYIQDKIDNLPQVETPDIEKMKQDIRNEFMDYLDKNINVLGMPDFRKLAMGLQAQIDEVRNTTPTSSGSLTVTIPTGDVDGSNVSFTVVSQPAFVISDGITYFDGAGYSYGALSITMDIPPSNSIRAIV